MSIRLGFTETTVLFFFYLDTLHIDKTYYKDSQHSLLNWLYTTSGFYDKQIKGSYFDFNTNMILSSQVYHQYFSTVLNILKNTNLHVFLCFHKIHDSLLPYKEAFLQHINYYHKAQPMHIFDFMRNKKLLIINNFGCLMQQQYNSGNLKYIHSNFPMIQKIEYLLNGYTFFNNGPNQSILETANHLCNNINNYDFDACVISSGAYSILLANHVHNVLHKEVFIIGGDLPFYFGIKTQRTINFHKDKINEYFISVPEELKPDGYQKIENGSYW
jgi:hypothetical protein